MSAELVRNYNKRVIGDGIGRQQVVLVDDRERVLRTLENGEPVTMKDAMLKPISSQKRKNLLANISHVEVSLARLAKTCREMREEVSSLTTED